MHDMCLLSRMFEISVSPYARYSFHMRSCYVPQVAQRIVLPSLICTAITTVTCLVYSYVLIIRCAACGLHTHLGRVVPACGW